MNTRTLAILGIVTILVAALAYWSLSGRGGTSAPTTAGASTKLASSVFVPGLAQKANDVGSITVKGSGKETVVKKVGSEWVLENRGNYPVEFEKVRDAVLSVSDLLIFEPKTTDASKYSFLGVDDPTDGAGSTSRLVTFGDTNNRVIGSVIVGSSTASFGNAPGSTTSYAVYVRRSGESQAFMAKGRLDPRATLDPDPVTWVKREAMNIEQQRIKSVAIAHPEGPAVNIAKEKKADRDYTLVNIPAGRELKFGGSAGQVAGALASLTFDDVAPVAEIAEGATPTASAEFRTYDGLVVSVDTSTKGGTAWANFTARYEAPPEPEPVPSDQAAPQPPKPEAEVRKEAQELNDRLAKWAFALPAFKLKQMVSTMDDLLKPADQTPVKIDQGAAEKKPVVPPSGDPAAPIEK